METLEQLTTRELILAIAAATDHDPVPDRRKELLLELTGRDLDLHTCKPSGAPAVRLSRTTSSCSASHLTCWTS